MSHFRRRRGPGSRRPRRLGDRAGRSRRRRLLAEPGFGIRDRDSRTTRCERRHRCSNREPRIPNPESRIPNPEEIALTPDMIPRAGIKTVAAVKGDRDHAAPPPGRRQPNAYKNVDVTSLVSGRVTQVRAELGQRVMAERRARDGLQSRARGRADRLHRGARRPPRPRSAARLAHAARSTRSARRAGRSSRGSRPRSAEMDRAVGDRAFAARAPRHS